VGDCDCMSGFTTYSDSCVVCPYGYYKTLSGQPLVHCVRRLEEGDNAIRQLGHRLRRVSSEYPLDSCGRKLHRMPAPQSVSAGLCDLQLLHLQGGIWLDSDSARGMLLLDGVCVIIYVQFSSVDHRGRYGCGGGGFFSSFWDRIWAE
jgi:hypothetical protein